MGLALARMKSATMRTYRQSDTAEETFEVWRLATPSPLSPLGEPTSADGVVAYAKVATVRGVLTTRRGLSSGVSGMTEALAGPTAILDLIFTCRVHENVRPQDQLRKTGTIFKVHDVMTSSGHHKECMLMQGQQDDNGLPLV